MLRAQVILYAHVSIIQHLYTNWLTSSSSQVSVEIEQNLLIRPVFIESILKGINSITYSPPPHLVNYIFHIINYSSAKYKFLANVNYVTFTICYRNSVRLSVVFCRL